MAGVIAIEPYQQQELVGAGVLVAEPLVGAMVAVRAMVVGGMVVV